MSEILSADPTALNTRGEPGLEQFSLSNVEAVDNDRLVRISLPESGLLEEFVNRLDMEDAPDLGHIADWAKCTRKRLTRHCGA